MQEKHAVKMETIYLNPVNKLLTYGDCRSKNYPRKTLRSLLPATANEHWGRWGRESLRGGSECGKNTKSKWKSPARRGCLRGRRGGRD